MAVVHCQTAKCTNLLNDNDLLQHFLALGVYFVQPEAVFRICSGTLGVLLLLGWLLLLLRPCL